MWIGCRREKDSEYLSPCPANPSWLSELRMPLVMLSRLLLPLQLLSSVNTEEGSRSPLLRKQPPAPRSNDAFITSLQLLKTKQPYMFTDIFKSASQIKLRRPTHWLTSNRSLVSWFTIYANIIMLLKLTPRGGANDLICYINNSYFLASPCTLHISSDPTYTPYFLGLSDFIFSWAPQCTL